LCHLNVFNYNKYLKLLVIGCFSFLTQQYTSIHIICGKIMVYYLLCTCMTTLLILTIILYFKIEFKIIWHTNDNNIFLDDAGFNFVTKCIQTVELRGIYWYNIYLTKQICLILILLLLTGLDEQGLYRVGGVSSKITKLLAMGLDRRKTTNGLNSLSFLDDCIEWETKTITSALKLYLRNLPEPLMTFKYHNAFISAASKMTIHY